MIRRQLNRPNKNAKTLGRGRLGRRLARTVERAYTLLEIKSVAADRRTFSGIASTPELDREGDMVDPAGVRFRNPVPLLFHHDQTQPIGTANLSVTADGILFEARLPIVDEPGPLKTRVDDAWQMHQGRR